MFALAKDSFIQILGKFEGAEEYLPKLVMYDYLQN